MTGAYLFNTNRKPIEVEYLTDKERYDIFIKRDKEEIIRWLDLVCNKLAELEDVFQLNQDN